MSTHKGTTITLIPQEVVENKIYLIRGKKVMIDRDLSRLYQIETKQLKRAVKRNADRFPCDFMFVLSKHEFENWRCQIGTSNSDKMGLRYAPMAFTEHGVAMLSSVLNSKRAIHVNIQIMRAFVRIRELIAQHKDLQVRIDTLEATLTKQIEGKLGIYDKQFKIVLRAFSATRRGGFAVFRKKM